jgi:hypothetical protein
LHPFRLAFWLENVFVGTERADKSALAMDGKTGVPEKCFIFWGGIIDFPGRRSFAIEPIAKLRLRRSFVM